MTTLDRAVTQAIAAIDCFLEETSSRMVTFEQLHSLSEAIEVARGIRTSALEKNPKLCSLWQLYRKRLEQLRVRLAETETTLRVEQARLAEENDRVSSVRAWHAQFTATQ